MAYSNWGGKVFLNNKPMHTFCDESPLDLLDLSSSNHRINLILNRTYHCILGNSLNTLALIYKSTVAAIIVNGSLIYEYDKVCGIGQTKVTKKGNRSLQLLHKNKKFIIKKYGNRKKISVEFSDFEGANWIAVCGLEFGEGYEKW
ncbi:MAG: hypothetical protein WDZ91_10445 [Paenibacillaceae bacterium]